MRFTQEPVSHFLWILRALLGDIHRCAEGLSAESPGGSIPTGVRNAGGGMGGDGRGDIPPADDRGVDDGFPVALVGAVSGPPGPESAAAVAQALTMLSSSSSSSWSGRAASSLPAFVVAGLRARVFAAQERLSGWVTYTRLAQAADWLRDWRARPPIWSGLPDEPA